MPAQQGQIQRSVSRAGLVSYQLLVWHDELGKHRTIKAADSSLVRRMATMQLQDWKEQWARREAKAAVGAQVQAAKESKAEQKQYQDGQKQAASRRTEEASKELDAIANLLSFTLERKDAINWEKLKDKTPFSLAAPTRPPLPLTPGTTLLPRKPEITDYAYQPTLDFFDRLLTKRRDKKLAKARLRYEKHFAEWEGICQLAKAVDAERELTYQRQVAEENKEYDRLLQAWNRDKDSYLVRQREKNAAIDQQRERYLLGDKNAIMSYCDMVLANSEYPDFMPNEWELDYNSDTKIVIVNYSLPSISSLPALVEVKYAASRDEFSEKHMNEGQAAKQYDQVLYQITLRTIHELFESDAVEAISVITFNGYVRAIDRSTGNETNTCVLSLQAKRDEFRNFNLSRVDPKACFRQLRGIGSSRLHSLTAVAPVMEICRNDDRFVSSYEVAHRLDEGYNLATMDWEDFEHLIRELFAGEFSSNGGEVRVTQASRDGGVDAIAFDPDPIRGGKIVIQAKRYSNTVGVAFVRDLFGTVMNEGAMKGILVTTSDYGPDAYEFAKGKPLTLLNGGNLLHLLEKHGHKARIDLREAREAVNGRG